MTRTRLGTLAAALAATTLLAGPALAAPGETDAEINAELAEVRRATSQYHDVDAAVADGYVLDDHCVEGMGFHAVRTPFNEVDAKVDHRQPEALVYAPGADGLKLVAVEYLSSEENTTLFGRTFDPPHEPVPASLHAWVWRGNPDGVFNPTHPKIACPE